MVDTRTTAGPAALGAAARTPPQQPQERFIGQISTGAILCTIGPKLPALRSFERWLQKRPIEYSDVAAEIRGTLAGWLNAFGDHLGVHANEGAAKVDVTAELLRRWFGDAMLQQAVHISDLRRASIVDLLRLLDYPNEYVPVLTRHDSAIEGEPVAERVDVVDKNALNARLAHSYLVELRDRARIS